MKLVFCSIFTALSFVGAVMADTSVPLDLEKLIRKPPSISMGMKRDLDAHKIPENGIIIDSDNFICYISIGPSDQVNDHPFLFGSNYKYITYSKKFNLVIRGMGDVFEKNISISDPVKRPDKVTLMDAGSKTEINCGAFRVLWSAGNHIYVNRDIKTYLKTETQFWLLLEEFRKK